MTPDPIRPRPADRQWLLQAHPGDATRIAATTGLMLGDTMLRATARGEWQVLHLAPDEWLLIGAGDPTRAFAAIDVAHSLVDVSDRTIGRLLAEPEARDLLAGACSLDLDGVPVGYCARTLFGKVTALVWRIDADTWRVDVARSYEGYVDALLAAIGAGLAVSA